MISWKETLRLPRSTFKNRPNLQLLLKDSLDQLYSWQTLHRPLQDKFILHDGPPYANGPLHLGHALNKILKDIILRAQVQNGKRVLYRPGWDCHGLPIEMKALEADAARRLSPVSIRRSAKQLATLTIAEQLKGFQSFGVMAAWGDKWTTMDHAFEIRQLRIFQKMLRHGLIYRKYKPVYWSPTSRTALAEAELEYRDDHVSRAAYIRYPIISGDLDIPGLAQLSDGLYAAVWTTTPWTLTANMAIAINRDLVYSVLRIGNYGLLVASSRVESLREHLPPFHVLTDSISGERLAGLQYRNKLRGEAAPTQPIVHAGFVSDGSGTGLVHMAPGHGQDDYEACSALGIDAFAPIDDGGHFTQEAYPDQPQILTSAPSILDGGVQSVLDLVGEDVLSTHQLRHKYPYDWRTKQPVVQRATAQWFADVVSIKKAALAALQRVRFVPESGRARLESFIKRRREWCISRQRFWGVPIPALYDADGNAVTTDESVEHIISVMQERTSEAWFSDDADDAAWIAPSLKGSYRRGTETMDVWFDSGSSWTETGQQADVYLEGSDQHRGWFQSSLLTYVADQKLDGKADDEVAAPFKTLVTHGFVLDAQGRKMSKSLGNTTGPDELTNGLLSPQRTKAKQASPKADALGPDALRLWVASSDFTTDVTVGPTVMQPVHNALVKYRMVIKMILGSLHQSSRWATLTKMDQIALVQLSDTMKQVREAMDGFEFSKATALINRWVVNDLSAFYVEALKDRLYCGDGGGALEPILIGFLRMLAPLTPLLVDEAWSNRPGWMIADDESSQHPGRQLYDAPLMGASRLTVAQSRLRRDLPTLMAVRDAVKAGLEEARAAGALGSSLQSRVVLETEDSELAATLGFYLDELDAMLVVSHVSLNEPVVECGHVKPFGSAARAHVLRPVQHKCPRCWRYLAVSEDELCGRCDEAVGRAEGGRDRMTPAAAATSW
ncbi:isoleucine-tRNA ligase [Ophiocordyceps camponoti-floridani]|uniref:Isoleucine--tRNA ligase, mitochondrial n=1 Tax=Ophiocordyceps camponoti-floridani TaxID=2030778 RepID=A0A8H4QAV2_9HYPO|nr:isoleucine-tRNA ligase [Ophiocordyceps camponoti-floridani]